jgi:hypothetical protein
MAERPIFRCLIVTAALAGGASALASETQTYAYDDLGRLVAVGYAGTINAGNQHSMCYDPADNRTRYRSDPAGAPAQCPAPAPVPTPTPEPTLTPPPAPNAMPVANTDSISVKVCVNGQKDVVANDTDPDGDYPLTLVSVGTTPIADVSIAGDGRSISVTGYSTPASGSVSYTIMDSRGAAATGTLNVTVTAGTGCQ